MDTGKANSQEPETGKVFHCARCGVESRERTCFIVPAQHSRPPHDVRCITCEQRRLAPTAIQALLVVIGSLSIPLWLVVGLAPPDVELGATTLAFTCLLYPLAVVMHELGHAVGGHLVGLEVGGISIGFGKVVCKFEVAGLPIRLYSWPISGRVYLGSPSAHRLRTRVGFATLMGPTTNILLATGTALWWKPLVSFFGSPAVYLWWIVNLVLAAFTLFPHRVQDSNQLVPSDGLKLLQLPRQPREKLEVYLYSAPLMRALSRYEDGDFPGALLLATKALARTPDIEALRLTQIASYLSAGEYQSGIQAIRLLLSGPVPQDVNIRAATQVNLAFGLVMTNIGATADNPQWQEADHLSRDAFEMYPCVLEYRCTRAFLLAATGRAEEALRVLDYDHFDTGTRRQRAQRQSARAFSLRMMNALQEAETAAAHAVQLDPAILKTVQSLGFSPQPGVKLVEPQRRKPTLAFTEELRPLNATDTVLARIAGAVLIVFGIALVALGSLGALRQIKLIPIVDRTAVVVILVLGLLSIFCLSVGYRLALNRPNRHGSILPPSGWIALTGLFGAVGLGLVATGFTANAVPRGTSAAALGSLAFAALCWRMRIAAISRS